ncbi:MAG TPA: zinc-ribbon domain-containing protein, partial [Desulfobacteria bacterium]|nr:zinc-ribbon domain-containing protein [Desulfobacteria bacterium]
MIIECQTCHARFRLDEARIKGRGARVKCRKCGDSIVVLKDSAPAPPPASGGEGFFDLGSAVRESAGEGPPSPPPVGNLIPFPALSRPAEPEAKESTSPFPEAAGAEKDEVDLAFERVLSPGAVESSPSIGETEAAISAPAESGAPPEEEAPAGLGPRPEPDLRALILDFEPEEKLDLPPAGALEPSIVEPPVVEPSAEFRAEGGFLISDSDTLDFLQEKHRDAVTEARPGIGDISLEISSAPTDRTDSFQREPDASPASTIQWDSPTPEG